MNPPNRIEIPNDLPEEFRKLLHMYVQWVRERGIQARPGVDDPRGTHEVARRMWESFRNAYNDFFEEPRLPARSECKKYKDRGDDPCPWGRIFIECNNCDDPELDCPWGRRFVDCIAEVDK
jgi:hypothetical protein